MPDAKLGSGAIAAYLGSNPVSMYFGSTVILHGEVQNLALWSEDFTNAVWASGGNNTTTAGAVAGPSGMGLATRILMPATSSTFINQDITLTAGKDYTVSVWLKAGPTHQQINFYRRTAAGGAITEQDLTVTSEWTRFEHTWSQLATELYKIGMQNTGDSQISDVYAIGWCVAEGPKAFGYRKTEGTAFTSYPPQRYFLSSTPRSLPVSIGERTAYIALGDSITAGSGATLAADRYTNIFAAANGLTLTNLGVGGRGVWDAADAIQGASFTRSNTLVSFMSGLNDTRRSSDQARELRKIEAGATAVAVSVLASTKVASNSASVTITGTTAAYDCDEYGGLYTGSATPGSGATSASASGVTWDYTFTGTNIAVQFIAGCGGVNGTETFGTVDIKIDDVTVEQIDLDEWYDGLPGSTEPYDNQRGPLARIFAGLSDGEHTITVETTSADIVPVDFFAELDAPESAAAIVFNEIPYLSVAGYAATPANGSTEDADAGSAVLRTLAETLRSEGHAAGYVTHNLTYYNINGGLSVDTIHPDDTGHAQIAAAMQAAVAT